MKFILKADKLTTNGSVFVEKGEYPVIRFFDTNRVLIDTAPVQFMENRQLTVVSLDDGELISGRD